MKSYFDHEKLSVYQSSIQFVAWLKNINEFIPKNHAVYNQLDRASTSIALNIAEGNGKYTPKDRCRYFDIAKGSALECAAALDILVAKEFLNQDQIDCGKQILKEIVSMIIGLIKYNMPDRFADASVDYGNEDEYSF